MININTRRKAIEAMNYCEKNHIVYQLAWNFNDQYRLTVPYSEQRIEIEYHLDYWERGEAK